jgi:hypothetical protein
MDWVGGAATRPGATAATPQSSAAPQRQRCLASGIPAEIDWLSAGSTSYHLSGLPQPTEAQKNLATMLNGIVVAGTAAVFGLLSDQEK